MRIVTLFILLMVPLYAFWFSTVQTKETEIKPPLLNIGFEETMALSYLNTLREKAGMSVYYHNDALKLAAKRHAKYLVANRELGHYETETKEYFSGRTPKKRAYTAGYQVGLITENVSVNAKNYEDSIDALFAAIYHRFGFLDFQSDEIGIGIYQDPKNTSFNAYVYDMGIYELNDLCSQESYAGVDRYVYKVCKDPSLHIEESLFQKALMLRKSLSQKVVIYPYHQQTNVPTAFYKEAPDPLPDYDVSGFPVSIQFNDYFYTHVRLRSFELYNQKGESVKGKILTAQNDPNQRFQKGQFAFFPYARLNYGEKYTAVVTYRADGKNGKKSWTFQTRPLQKPYFVINRTPSTIKIKPYTRYQIYFVPENPQDVLADLHFPADVHVKFLDQNTISPELLSNNRDPFTLKGDKPLLNITVTK